MVVGSIGEREVSMSQTSGMPLVICISVKPQQPRSDRSFLVRETLYKQFTSVGCFPEGAPAEVLSKELLSHSPIPQARDGFREEPAE